MSNQQQSVKMWSGRFREPLDPYFDNWQRSLKFDWQLLEQEIVASKAHAVALQAANILTATELATIRQALDSIWAQFLDPKLGGPGWVCDNPDAEDIHHFVELQLSARIGDLALKLHTGRSRNEQIATDLRLYVRSSIDSLTDQLAAWADALLAQATSAGEAVYARLHPSATRRTRPRRPLAARLRRDDPARRFAPSRLRKAPELLPARLRRGRRRDAQTRPQHRRQASSTSPRPPPTAWTRPAIATSSSNTSRRSP